MNEKKVEIKYFARLTYLCERRAYNREETGPWKGSWDDLTVQRFLQGGGCLWLVTRSRVEVAREIYNQHTTYPLHACLRREVNSFFISVPRGLSSFGQHQESRPPCRSSSGSLRFTDFLSNLSNLTGWEYETNNMRMLRKSGQARGHNIWSCKEWKLHILRVFSVTLFLYVISEVLDNQSPYSY